MLSVLCVYVLFSVINSRARIIVIIIHVCECVYFRACPKWLTLINQCYLIDTHFINLTLRQHNDLLDLVLNDVQKNKKCSKKCVWQK